MHFSGDSKRPPGPQVAETGRQEPPTQVQGTENLRSPSKSPYALYCRCQHQVHPLTSAQSTLVFHCLGTKAPSGHGGAVPTSTPPGPHCLRLSHGVPCREGTCCRHRLDASLPFITSNLFPKCLPVPRCQLVTRSQSTEGQSHGAEVLLHWPPPALHRGAFPAL